MALLVADHILKLDNKRLVAVFLGLLRALGVSGDSLLFGLNDRLEHLAGGVEDAAPGQLAATPPARLEEAGQPLHVGDTYTEEAARDVVRRLRFETGFYSRAWEISSAHITEEAGRYLANLADIDTPTRFLFVAFRIPYSPAVGVKLIATPWTDENLQRVEGITAERLRREHRRKGMPESLVEVLHLAALADVRLLIFDADAPVLDGLTLYYDE